MPADTNYSLTDLARLGDVTPRTIRYYISQGLLPSPGAGSGARYGEPHLARLRLIRRLQREHLPLAEIRRRLEDLSDDELRTLTEPATPLPPDSAVEYIRRIVTAAKPAQPQVLASGAGPIPLPSPVPSLPPSASPSLEPPDRSTWERHTLTPDVELHVRRPLDPRTSKQVDRLIRIGRELLADEP